MRTLQTLIDDAVKKCTSQSALGRRIGMTPGDVNKLQHGKLPFSPATVGLLCDVLELEGDEARRLAAEAVIAAAKGEKAGVLRRAFFGWPRVLGVALACGATGLAPTTSDAQTGVDVQPIASTTSAAPDAYNRAFSKGAGIYIVALLQ